MGSTAGSGLLQRESYADNPAFTSATTVCRQIGTSYTTVKNMTTGRYYWYVQMFDQDRRAVPSSRATTTSATRSSCRPP